MSTSIDRMFIVGLKNKSWRPSRDERENMGSKYGVNRCGDAGSMRLFHIIRPVDSYHTTTPRREPAATREGEDYLRFGPIYSTGTKSSPDPVVGFQGLMHIRALTPLPVFVIGGIRAESVAELCEAGTNGVAVISGILDAVDRQEAFRQYQTPFH
jgi:hypothetical protein